MNETDLAGLGLYSGKFPGGGTPDGENSGGILSLNGVHLVHQPAGSPLLVPVELLQL
jgi:hypothetical protein